MKLGITGDIHGDLNFKRIFQARRLGYTHLIVCGDFGYVWYNNLKEDKQLNYLNKIGVKILFVDGNHENNLALSNYNTSNMYGGKVHIIKDNIIHLIRGEYYTIGNNTFWCMGGANSTDKEYRKECKTWWKEEMPSSEELKYGLNNLNKHNNKVDYIITHTCYSSAIKILCDGIDFRIDSLTDYFTKIKDNVQFKHWYFGHMHKNYDFDYLNTSCLYNKIVEIK